MEAICTTIISLRHDDCCGDARHKVLGSLQGRPPTWWNSSPCSSRRVMITWHHQQRQQQHQQHQHPLRWRTLLLSSRQWYPKSSLMARHVLISCAPIPRLPCTWTFVEVWVAIDSIGRIFSLVDGWRFIDHVRQAIVKLRRKSFLFQGRCGWNCMYVC